MAIPVDILVIGGGLQGLVLLKELVHNGYSALLVTNAPLGSGQTLHSHGLLNSGYWIVRKEMRETLLKNVLPDVERLGLQTYGEKSWFVIANQNLSENLRSGWEVCGYDYEETYGDDIPQGFQEGALFQATDFRIFRIREYNYPKRQLIRLLSEGFHDRIIFGKATSFTFSSADSTPPKVQTVQVTVQDTDETTQIAPRIVITATGTGTRKLLCTMHDAAFSEHEENVNQSGTFSGMEEQLNNIKSRILHMICIQAPVSVLPPISALMPDFGLLIVGHMNKNHDDVNEAGESLVTWYVTPATPDQTSYDDVPDQAEATVNPSLTAAGIRNLIKVYPALLQEAEKADSPLRFAVFAGFKQDYGDQLAVPACEWVEGFANVMMALPSVSIHAWTNAENALSMIKPIIGEGSSFPGPSYSFNGAPIGNVNELSGEVEWMTWHELLQAYPEIEG